MIFDTKVQGIPCQCRVTLFSPSLPMKVFGSGMGDAHPPEHGDFEFVILDRKGAPAPWLEKQLTPNDNTRLFEEFKLEQEEEMYGPTH